MNKPNTDINTFKKSIESTIKAISKKSDINILFGSDNKSSYQNVNLPEVNKDKFYKLCAFWYEQSKKLFSLTTN